MTLRTPLSENTVRSLKLGETIHLSGTIVTGRDEMHMRAVESDDPTADILKEGVIYHCGPIMAETNDGWDVVAAGPTTSARMNSLEPEVIRKYRIRAIIGKGGMSKEVGEAMKETGCVYLAATGGTAVSLAGSLSVEDVKWQDLGMAEAMWVLRAERMGPLVVAMDADGNSLYDNVQRSLKR